MSTNKHALIRYEALDRCFSNKGRKFFIDDLIIYVSDAINDYTGKAASISRRQIFKDIDFMRSEAGFRAPIESYKEGKKSYYRYSKANYSIAIQQINPVEADSLKTAINILGRFSGLQQFEFVQELALKLKKSFQLEEIEECIFFDQNEYLRNINLLGDLLKYIQQKQVLEVKYKPFNKEIEETFVFHPYFLKQYNKRWFLFGKRDSFENWTNLALDRICSLNTLGNLVYIASKETHNAYFEDIVGVSKPANTESLIVSIKVSMALWPYIDSKPIHPSQTVVERTAEYVILTLDIIPNYEFFSHILGYGSAVEILAPVSVRDSMLKKLEDAISKYRL